MVLVVTLSTDQLKVFFRKHPLARFIDHPRKDFACFSKLNKDHDVLQSAMQLWEAQKSLDPWEMTQKPVVSLFVELLWTAGVMEGLHVFVEYDKDWDSRALLSKVFAEIKARWAASSAYEDFVWRGVIQEKLLDLVLLGKLQADITLVTFKDALMTEEVHGKEPITLAEPLDKFKRSSYGLLKIGFDPEQTMEFIKETVPKSLHLDNIPAYKLLLHKLNFYILEG